MVFGIWNTFLIVFPMLFEIDNPFFAYSSNGCRDRDFTFAFFPKAFETETPLLLLFPVVLSLKFNKTIQKSVFKTKNSGPLGRRGWRQTDTRVSPDGSQTARQTDPTLLFIFAMVFLRLRDTFKKKKRGNP